MLGGSLLGGSRFAGRYKSELYLLADEVKPPLDMVGHIGGIRGEQVHGKEGSMAAQVGEQWGALSSARRTYPVLLRDDVVASSRVGLCLVGRRMRYKGR